MVCGGEEHVPDAGDFATRELLGEPVFVVDSRDLVAKQDWVVCELSQRGVRSRFHTSGVYPRQEKYLREFNERYLTARDG